MKHLLKLSLLLLALLLPATATAHDFEVDGIYYNIKGNEASVTYPGTSLSQYSNEYSGDVTIPSTVTWEGTTYSVTSIDHYAFYGCSGLISIDIPNSVTSLGISAFQGCSGLISIDIPNSVTTIGDNAFSGCDGLTDVYSNILDPSLISMGSNVFYLVTNDYSIRTLHVPNSSKGAYLNDTKWNQYFNVILEMEFAPSISYDVYVNNIYYKISTGNSVEVLASDDCSNLIIPSQITYNNKHYTVIAIADSAFYGKQRLHNIILPETILSIGVAAFKNCQNLRYLTCLGITPPSLNESFDSHCQRIPFEGLGINDYEYDWDYQGNPSFWLVVYVSSDAYPNYKAAFQNTDYFSYITSHEVTSAPYFDESRHEGGEGHEGYYVHVYPSEESIVYSRCSESTAYGDSYFFWEWSEGDEAAYWIGPEFSCYYTHWCIQAFAIAEGKMPSAMCENEYAFSPAPIENFDFEESRFYYNILNDSSVEVTSGTYADPCDGEPLWIDEYAGDIVIPTSVRGYNITSIGENAFANCIGLTSVTIPEYVTHFGKDAFKGCTALKTLYYNALSCNDVAIYDTNGKHNPFNNSITSIIIGDGVPKIPAHLAYYLTNLESVTIPNSVTSIGDLAFYGCSGLKSIDIPNSVTSIGELAFCECNGLTSITIPNSVTRIFCGAFEECNSLTSISIGNSVTVIDDVVFAGCHKLTSVSIGNSVTTIGEGVFFDCDSLMSVTCLGMTPPTTYDCFDEQCYQNATLYVPIDAVEAYRNEFCWCEFQHIVGFYDYDFEQDGVYFKLTDDGGVVLTKGDNAYSGDVIVPSEVTYQGTVYPVTNINTGAFSGSTLNSLSIPVTVDSIGDGAFAGCTIQSLYITGSGEWTAGAIGAEVTNLFISSEETGIKGLQVNPAKIYSYAATPPVCNDQTFLGYNAELHVPAASLAAYFTAPYWCNFTNIIGDAVELIALTLDHDSIEALVGSMETLTPALNPANAVPGKITWTSTNEAVATVEDGVVALIGPGECDIVAACQGKTAVCHVTATVIMATGVALSLEFAKMEVGSSLTLTASVLPDDATYKNVTWATTDSAVATVNDGLVTAVAPGECFITATCGECQAMCHVIVVEHFVFITLDEHEVDLLPNHIITLTPTVTPASTELVVTSSDPTVAAARMASGLIQVVGVKEGTATIKVNSTDGYAEADSCVVNVITQIGDVNGDGFVNISDITSLISYVMGNSTGAINLENADVNYDDDVNITDVTLLISYVMGTGTLQPKDQRPIEYTVNGVKFNMMRVKGGTFNMGATVEMDSDANSNESPVHQVTLSTYYIGQTEVTQELWQAVMGTNPSNYTGDLQRPVEKVSFTDCEEFIAQLNALTGLHFRLPTEAEWEYAARGGNKSHNYRYAGSNDIDEVAWYTENSDGTTHPVATKQPNELGIYDMSGNVCEWCGEWFSVYTEEPQTNPVGPETGRSRVHRGGSLQFLEKNCAVTRRNYFAPGIVRTYMGLRLAL